MNRISYASEIALVNSYASECMQLTPIIPVPRAIDGWRGGGDGYEDAWHWDFGSVYVRSSHIDIVFGKEKCEALEVSREYCRDEFAECHPGGLKVDNRGYDSLSLRYYFINSPIGDRPCP